MDYTEGENIALKDLDQCIAQYDEIKISRVSLMLLRCIIKKYERGGDKSTYEQMWDQRRKKHTAARSAGKVLILSVGKRAIHVVAPYSKTFLDAAHAAGGVWKQRTKIWTFRKHTYYEVKALCEAHYPASSFEV